MKYIKSPRIQTKMQGLNYSSHEEYRQIDGYEYQVCTSGRPQHKEQTRKI
jgi:hypothetical protein